MKVRTKKATVCVLTFNYIILLLGVGSIIASVATPAWWVRDLSRGKYENGVLFNYYKSSDDGIKEYGLRDNLLQFKHDNTDPNGDHRDIILLCLLISSAINVIAIFVYCFLFQLHGASWLCLTITNAIFESTSAIISCGGMIYCEIKFRFIYQNIDRSSCWSYILAWIGSGLLFISFIISIILIFMTPKTFHDKIVITNTKSEQQNEAFEAENGDKPIRTVIVHKGKPNEVVKENA